MKLKRIAWVIAGVAAATLLIAPAAVASNVLVVDGATSPVADVPFTGSLTGTATALTNFGVTTSCSVGSISGYMKKGASVTAGTKIGAITSATLGSGANPCACASTYPSTVKKYNPAGEWGIYVTSTPTKGQASVSVEIRNVSADVQSTGPVPWACEYRFAGLAPGTFNQATQRLAFVPAGGSYPLAIAAFNGAGTGTVGSGVTAGGLIYTGDSTNLAATFNLVTPGTGGVHW